MSRYLTNTVATREALTARSGLLTSPWAVLFVALYALAIYWISAFKFASARYDFIYLADAFLHGRTWIIGPLAGEPDTIALAGHTYLPFGPFPGVLFMPLVALFGVEPLTVVESGINSALAAINVGLAWTLISRFDGGLVRHRLWIIALFAFGTAQWWIVVRGGAWHMAQLVTVGLTLIALVESSGRRRAWVMGLAGTAAFLTRLPLIFAMPLYVALAARGASGLPRPRVEDIRAWLRAGVVVGIAAAGLGALGLYNVSRFGSPFETGYSLATLPQTISETRDFGLFSAAYLPRNLDYLLWHLPVLISGPPFIKPDGFGLSILITSPALLLAAWANLLRPYLAAVAVTAGLVLLPNLLYYGGGWFQFGFRYFLDAAPFALVLVADGARRNFGAAWRWLIGWSVLVSIYGVVWSYQVGRNVSQLIR